MSGGGRGRGGIKRGMGPILKREVREDEHRGQPCVSRSLIYRSTTVSLLLMLSFSLTHIYTHTQQDKLKQTSRTCDLLGTQLENTHLNNMKLHQTVQLNTLH